MIYKTYGKTGIKVSTIGFGGMRFANQKDVDACASLVQAAYDAGINYFDTAPGYGDSELLFGAAFKQMLRTRAKRPFYVATKSMRVEPDEVRAELEKSLQRMGLDAVDFHHVWCVMSPEDYNRRKLAHTLQAFERARDEGLVRHVVVSTHMAGPDVADMLDDYPFEGVLLGYSAMNFAYREAGVAAAARLGLGVVAMNPLGGGIIPQNTERFEFLRTQPDEDIVAAALRFLIHDPRVTVALVGMANPADLHAALEAVKGFRPIPPAALERIRSELKTAFNALCTGCRYCEPCAAAGVPISKLMDAFNHQVLSNRPTALLDRLRNHWNIRPDDPLMRACTQCGQCEQCCTQHLPIRERLDAVRRAADAAVSR